jgi:DNA repair exonuclease SbcCD ATPase subunit
MKLISLVAKNFKKLSDFRCDFQDGLNIIVGENAQGKSTLLQAIEASLFGVTVVPGKKENIPTWGQTNFSLELHFHAAPANYILTRNKATAKLMRYDFNTDGEELVANGNTPVTAYIEQMLGLTAKDFNLFVQSKQGETAGVLTFGATALNQKVEEFAGVSLIDAVQGKAQSRASTAKARADAFSVEGGEMSAAAQALHDATEHYDLKYEEHQNAGNASDSQPRLTAVEPLVSSEELSRAQRVAQRAQSALREAEAALAHAEEASEAAELAVQQADSPIIVAELEAVAAKQRAELRRVKGELSNGQEMLSTAQRVAEELKRARAALSGAHEPTEQDVLDADHAYQAHATAQSEKSNHLAVLKSQLDALVKLAGDATCPTCGTTLAEHDPDALAAETETLMLSIADARTALQTATADKSAEQALDAVRGQVAARATLADKVTTLLTKLVSDEDVEDLAKRVQALTDVV